MKKSFFRKFFLAYTSVTCIAIVVLGAIIYTFTGSYWLQTKRSALSAEADAIAQQAGVLGGNLRYIMQITEIVTSATESHVLVIIDDGTVAISDASTVNDGVTEISSDIAATALTGTYSAIGDLGGALKEKSVIVSAPITVGGETAGAVFSFIPYAGLGIFLSNILKIFVLSALCVLAIILLVTSLLTANMVHPLRDMADAARRMSKGDFSKYIRVNREDEIGELAVAFNNMTHSLSVSEQQHRGFVANVSHELKTPMTTISGFIDGILDGTITGDRQKEYLEIVSAEVKRLSRLVTSMLNLSKLEAGEIEIKKQAVNIPRTVLSVAIQLENQISDKDITMEGLDSLEPTAVVADRDLMYQVVFNLMDNAIKYTPAGGRVIVKTENSQEGLSSLTITNTGVGIPEKDLPYVFDRFYKVDKSRGADKKGTGLGLYLVKTILAMLDGQITVKSKEGEYCEFTVLMQSAPLPDNNNHTEE